jgi:plastocyanin
MGPLTRGFTTGLAASLLLCGGMLVALADTSTASAASAETRTITMSGSAFRPRTIEINLGDSVTWTNDDFFPHTATGTRFDSGRIAAGGSWTFRPEAKGDYPYLCTLHPTMRGVLRVK